jgi:hypothetical protein
MHETGTAKQRARSTRLHATVETRSDITYVDRTETSLRADIQPLWADLPQSALGSANTLQNVAHNNVHRKLYLLETFVIMHEDA